MSEEEFDFPGTAQKIGERMELAGVYFADGAPASAARCLREAAELCDTFARQRNLALEKLCKEEG